MVAGCSAGGIGSGLRTGVKSQGEGLERRVVKGQVLGLWLGSVLLSSSCAS